MDQEIQELILQLNREAMNYLKLDQTEHAVKTLKYAQEVLDKQPSPQNLKLHGITLNNFGCFYKKIQKPNVALKYLKKALDKESVEPVDKVNLAGTLINICAIFSQLGKHQQALMHSLRALGLLKDLESASQNYLTTVVIAYHNTGVEYEFLGNLRDAVDCYKDALDLARDHLGEAHSLTVSMKKSYGDALEKLEKVEVRNAGKLQRRTLLGFSRSEKRNHQVSPVVGTGVKKRKVSVRIEKVVVREEVRTDVNVKDLEHVRFLTGDRLQPMHPLKELTRKMRTTGDFAKDHTNSNIPSKSNTRGSSRCKMRDNSQINGLKQASKTAKTHFDIQKSEKTQHPDTFTNLNEPIDQSKPDLLHQLLNKSHKKSQNSPKSLKKTKQNLKPRKVSPPPNFKLKTYANPLIIETSPSKSFTTYSKIEPSQKPKYSPEANIEWIKKPENIEKFKVLEEFIKHEDELQSASSAIPANYKNLLTSQTHSHKRPPLTITKAIFRGYLHRKIELNKISSIIKIQKTVKMHQCRRIYKDIKQAILFIQSVYRGYSTRKKLASHSTVHI